MVRKAPDKAVSAFKQIKPGRSREVVREIAVNQSQTINWIIEQNYGFLNELPDPGTLFDHMGPYPYYLITLQGIAFTLYFILLKIAPKPSTEKLPEISGKTRAS